MIKVKFWNKSMENQQAVKDRMKEMMSPAISHPADSSEPFGGEGGWNEGGNRLKQYLK